MTTTLQQNDPRIDRLDPEDAAALRGVIAATDAASRNARVDPWMTSLGLPPIPAGSVVVSRPILDARELSARAREVLPLLVETEVDLARFPVFSVPSWLRRWLGIDPPGVLFGEIEGGNERTLIAAIRARPAHELPALLATLPIAERVEVLVDLLEGGRDYHAGSASQPLAALVRELDGSAGAWAARAADAPSSFAKNDPRERERERAIFIALARAKVPIEPRWDALVPLSHGAFARWAMEECLMAIPPERRAGAVLARLARARVNEGPLYMAADALAIVPDASIVRWMLERWDDYGRPAAVLEAIRAAGRDEPSLLELVSAAEKPPALVPRALPVDDDDASTRAQREVLGRGAERDEPMVLEAARRFALDRDGVPAFDVWLSTDSGVVFRAGTAEVIAEIVQGGIETSDATLRRELRNALVAARDLRAPKRAARGPAKTKDTARSSAAPKRPRKPRG
jgi:hypothetical protein